MQRLNPRVRISMYRWCACWNAEKAKIGIIAGRVCVGVCVGAEVGV